MKISNPRITRIKSDLDKLDNDHRKAALVYFKMCDDFNQFKIAIESFENDFHTTARAITKGMDDSFFQLHNDELANYLESIIKKV